MSCAGPGFGSSKPWSASGISGRSVRTTRSLGVAGIRVTVGERHPGSKLCDHVEDLTSPRMSSQIRNGTTVRKAVAALRDQGYVYSVHGLGTFVSPPEDRKDG